MPRAKKNLSAILDVVEEQVINEVPQELKDQLNALEPVEEDSSAMESSWDSAAQEIERIDERAEIAIQIITQSIKTQATVAKGRVILEVREKFGHRPDFEGTLDDFAKRLGVTDTTIMRWIGAAQAVDQHSNVFGDDYMMSLAPTTLDMLNSLPMTVQEAMLSDGIEEGKRIQKADVKEVAKSIPVQLLSAQEKLEKKQVIVETATELMAEAKENGATYRTNPEYADLHQQAKNAAQAIETLNEKIATLKADLVGEKAKAESAIKAQEALNKELEALKWDDETTREQRVKRIQSTLTVAMPNVLADLMRFVTEEAHYSDAYKKSIREQMVQLHTFLGEHNI